MRTKFTLAAIALVFSTASFANTVSESQTDGVSTKSRTLTSDRVYTESHCLELPGTSTRRCITQTKTLTEEEFPAMLASFQLSAMSLESQAQAIGEALSQQQQGYSSSQGETRSMSRSLSSSRSKASQEVSFKKAGKL